MVPGLEDDDKCRQNRLHDCHQIEIPFIFSVPKTWKTALIRAVFYVFNMDQPDHSSLSKIHFRARSSKVVNYKWSKDTTS